jgi:hypothetical protein
VRGEDPAEDDAGVLPPEDLGGQRDRRRQRRDPVEAVEDDEEDQAEVRRAEDVGQREEAQAAERVVPEEQDARVVAVGEPAGAGRADDVEHADDGKQARRGNLAQPVIDRGRNEVGPDQPVRRRTADEEAAGEQPERS